jgi:hypothetical protein
MSDLTTLTDVALTQLRVDVEAEQRRRNLVASAPDTVAGINAGYLAATGIEQGDPWRQPVGAHDAYPLGWTVTDAGKTWESTIGGNVWRPGVTGWREVVTGGGLPAWVQPLGAQDAYALGARVTHNGQTWTSGYAANVWEPGVFGWTADPA